MVMHSFKSLHFIIVFNVCVKAWLVLFYVQSEIEFCIDFIIINVELQLPLV